MPSADGKFKGQGWTRARETAWERAFNGPQTRTLPCTKCGPQRSWAHESHSQIPICKTCGSDLDITPAEQLRADYERHLVVLEPEPKFIEQVRELFSRARPG